MKWKVWFLILWLFIYTDAFSACSYQSKIDTCTQAQKNQTHREITDFMCISASPEQRVYQIILDERFQKIDEEIENYIKNLEENKWYYFWKDKQESYVDAVQNIINAYRVDGQFWKMYYNVCSGIQEEVIECMPYKSTQINNAAYYYWGTPTACTLLADQKLAIYKQVSYDLLLINKLQVSRDEKKLYLQEERSKYDTLLSKFMINIWYVERIWAKWPSKIRNTSGN